MLWARRGQPAAPGPLPAGPGVAQAPLLHAEERALGCPAPDAGCQAPCSLRHRRLPAPAHPGRRTGATARAQEFLFRAVDLGLRLSAAFQSASGAAHGRRPNLRMRQSEMSMQCSASAAA